MAKHPSIIFAFDITGTPLGSGTIIELSAKFGVSAATIRSALSRGGVARERYYFAKTQEFSPVQKPYSKNPIHKKSAKSHSIMAAGKWLGEIDVIHNEDL